MIITSSETKNKKYKQRQKRSNGLYPLNYLKADWANTPKLTTFSMAYAYHRAMVPLSGKSRQFASLSLEFTSTIRGSTI